MRTDVLLLDNILWGVQKALWFIGVYTFVGGAATFARVIMGQAPAVWLLLVPVLYVIGGTLAGALVGALRPLARNIFGGYLVGAIASLPIAVGGRLLLLGFTPWTADDTAIVMIYGLTLGGLCGVSAVIVNKMS